jgi:hypothetical protein
LNDPTTAPQSLEQQADRVAEATAEAEQFAAALDVATQLPDSLKAAELDMGTLEANIQQARTLLQTLAQRGENWKEFVRIRDQANAQLDAVRKPLEQAQLSPMQQLPEAEILYDRLTVSLLNNDTKIINVNLFIPKLETQTLGIFRSLTRKGMCFPCQKQMRFTERNLLY